MRLPVLLGCALACQLAVGREPDLKTGGVQGRITFAGEAPKSLLPDDAGVRHELIEVDPKTRGLRYTVVYLIITNRAAVAPPRNKMAVDQVDYKFTPRVIAVQEGEPVLFTNSDPANHNVRSVASNRTNEFNIFTGVDGKYEHRFVRELQEGPVRLGCDIHPWMRGWVFVFAHPYFAVTDASGHFRIAGVPPGEHELRIVQPDIRHDQRRKIVVNPGETCNVEAVIRRDQNPHEQE